MILAHVNHVFLKDYDTGNQNVDILFHGYNMFLKERS